jgi:hypothetical protein
VTWIGVNQESEIGTQDWVTDSGFSKEADPGSGHDTPFCSLVTPQK